MSSSLPRHRDCSDRVQNQRNPNRTNRNSDRYPERHELKEKNSRKAAFACGQVSAGERKKVWAISAENDASATLALSGGKPRGSCQRKTMVVKHPQNVINICSSRFFLRKLRSTKRDARKGLSEKNTASSLEGKRRLDLFHPVPSDL